MAWQRNYVTLKSGERIRYSFFSKPESPALYVRFKGKERRWVKASTGRTRKADAIEGAHRLILEHFEQIAPASERMDWAAAVAKLREAMLADNKRPRTIKGYEETLRRLREMFPLAKGPADITDRMAGDFKRKYASGTYSRKPSRNGETVPSYRRVTKSLDSRIRSLKAVFGWFKQLHLVDENPFEGIEQPEMDRCEVKYVRPEDLAEFLSWLEGRYPGWRMPHLFFEVKALTGCRLQDICELRSEQLREGRLVFEADQTKNRSERYAILPADIYAELEAYKGETFLWERYPAELRVFVKGTSRHCVLDDFSADRMANWIRAVMRDYQNETGADLSSHDFRKAAFTRAAEAGIHVKRGAVAFDVTAETMLKYYTGTEKKQTADEVLSQLHEVLRPRKSDPKVSQSAGEEAKEGGENRPN
jgi:integrase